MFGVLTLAFPWYFYETIKKAAGLGPGPFAGLKKQLAEKKVAAMKKHSKVAAEAGSTNVSSRGAALAASSAAPFSSAAMSASSVAEPSVTSVAEDASSMAPSSQVESGLGSGGGGSSAAGPSSKVGRPPCLLPDCAA